MTTSVLARIQEMFAAPQSSSGDVILEEMFKSVLTIAESNQFKDKSKWKHSTESLDFIEECLIYITRDRPRQVDAIIEAELEGVATNYLTCYLEEDDLRNLNGIMEYRKIIFEKHEN